MVEDIKIFPLPEFIDEVNGSLYAELGELAGQIFEKKLFGQTEYEDRVDELVYELYMLNKSDIKIIEGSFKKVQWQTAK